MVSPWKKSFDEAFPEGIPEPPTVPGVRIRGTHYFVDRHAAAAFYKRQYHDLTTFELATILAAKEHDGEFKIGYPPNCRPGDAILLDGGTRYGIIECTQDITCSE